MLLFGGLLSPLLAGGCGEVESCKELDKGCINGVPDESGKCQFGLVLNAAGNLCVKPGDPDASTSNPGESCSCPSGQLCRADKSCVDPCVAPTNLPTPKAVLKTCRPADGEDDYDFSTAAIALCYQACSHRAEYCGSACDPTKECTSVLATTGASALCPAQSPECAMTACETARDTKCADQKCAGTAAPSCAGVVCNNNCANSSFNNDGICDDADLSNAQSGVCDWGSDCGDCGPRRGTAPTFSVGPGDPCVDPLQCGGNTDDVTKATGWCLVADKDEQSRCLPDCSLGKTCTAGFTCFTLKQVADDGTSTMVVDDSGRQASACFPTQCGN